MSITQQYYTLGCAKIMFCAMGSSEHHGLLVDFSTKIYSVFSQRKAKWVWAQILVSGSELLCRGVGLCSWCSSHSPFPSPSGKLLPSPVWIRPLSLSSFVQSCLSSHIAPLQSETPSQQLPLSITLPGSPDYQEENWSEHLPVLINCVAQVI